ncbi:MFS multidrug transporter-like protein [Clohesyomyces aquaticus]|uniref:MFS multidrug transporter-like protein n=1 Tax=Clohesyomyces aquaticus TaxID=1231657 RepID=A0A1Y1YEY7_9PLEO|nr:MFS multidrug transporter-like protein [Clohesyomyces aquaticus]
MRGEAQIQKWRLVSLYVSVCSGLFLSFLDTSIVATALYTVGVEFHSLAKVNWVALAYTLAYLGCTAIFASLSDVFGRRNAWIAAMVLFLAFSIGCGFAQSLNQLIALRALQGVGGSGLYSVGFVILPEVSPLKMLKMIGALAGTVVAMAGVLGPVLGGIITNYTTWRWVFLINGPIGIGPLILFFLAWPNSTQLRPAERRSFRQMDILGFFLLIAASVPFVFAFQEAGIHIAENRAVWRSAIFIAPLIIGIICWFALFGWEWAIFRRWGDSIDALFPVRLARKRVYLSAVISTMLTGYPYFAVIYSLPTRFQVVNGHSALASGVALLPMLGSAAIGSTLAGIISGKKNNTFPVMMLGAVLMLIGTATLSTLENTIHTQARAYGLQVFVGFGFGLTISSSSLLAALESEIRDSAVAQGIMAQVRMLGGSIGIAASTAILGVKQRQKLLETGIVSPRELDALRDNMPKLSSQQVHEVRQAYTEAFNESLVVCSILAGVCIVVTAGCWQKNAPTLEERRNQQVRDEAMRQRTLGEAKAKAAATGVTVEGLAEAHDDSKV